MNPVAPTLAEAVRCYREGNLHRAERICHELLASDPGNEHVVNLLGVIAFRSGDSATAADLFNQAIRLRPDYPEALSNLGSILKAAGNLDDAVAVYRQALECQPDFADAHNNLAIALRDQGKLDEAGAHFQEVLALLPNHADARNNLGMVYRRQGRLEEAIACYREVIRLQPNDVKPHNNLGNAFMAQGKLEEAVACFRQAIGLEPRYAHAHSNLGIALMSQRKLEEAVASLEHAVRLDPNFADAHRNLGMARLLAGNYEQGWPEYEWRWRCAELRPRSFQQPPWDGGLLAGRTILLHAEQDSGDMLQFVRYAPLVKERGGAVIVECHRLLVPLLSTCRGIDQVVPLGSALPFFDTYAPLASLPGIFKTTLQTVPADVPYLFADAGRIERWRGLLSPRETPAWWDTPALGNKGFAPSFGRASGWSLEVRKPEAQAKDVSPFARASGWSLGAQMPGAQADDASPFARASGWSLGAQMPGAQADDASPFARASGWSLGAQMPGAQADDVSPFARGLSLGNAAPAGAVFKVGIIWRGNNNPAERCIPLAQWTPLRGLSGVQWVSLQPAPTPEERQELAGLGAANVGNVRPPAPSFEEREEMASRPPVIDLGSLFENFADIAAAMAGVDLIVTIDTAAAHCAGALGLPVWVLLPFAPDWRWLLDREDSPWYPTMRLFRQKRWGDWTEVLERVAVELQKTSESSNRANLERIAAQPKEPARAKSAALAAAGQCHREGDISGAEKICREILASEPSNADALHLLGVLALQAGDNDRGMNLLSQAVRLRPDDPEMLNNLGTALVASGRLDDAVVQYRKAIELKPAFANPHNNLGGLLRDQGKLDDREGNIPGAEKICREILASEPSNADALHLLGLLALQTGDSARGMELLSQAVRLRPDDAEILNNLGTALVASGRLDDAVVQYRKAIELKPAFASPHNNLGGVLRDQGKLEEAIDTLRRAIALNPSDAQTHYNMGNLLRDAGRLDEALAHFDKAIELKPDYAEAFNNRGAVLEKQGKLDLAADAFRQTLRVNPKHVPACSNLGSVLTSQGRAEEAIAYLQRAIRLDANFPDAHFNLGIAWLLSGNYEQAWPEYEWRWHRPDCPPWVHPQPLWDGSELAGRTVLLYSEQGLGDTLQFVRYAALVKQRGGAVILACQGPLIPLVSTCPGIDRVVSRDSPPPPFDTRAPIMSLPGLFKTSLETIPGDVPYLFADAGLIERWRNIISSSAPSAAGNNPEAQAAGSNPEAQAAANEPEAQAKDDLMSPFARASGLSHPAAGLKVGAVWRGKEKPNPARSIRFEQLAPLTELPGTRWFSLQIDPSAEERLGMEGCIIDLGGRFESFADTAAAMANLDLIVTIDTAAAHCAGALGLPVWVLLPFAADWRWGMNRGDSPWYPTMRLFRQKRPGDWTEVLQRVVVELQKTCGSESRPTIGKIDEQLGAAHSAPAASELSLSPGTPGEKGVRESPFALPSPFEGSGGKRGEARELETAQQFNNLGVALRMQGKLEEAIGSLGRALELKPAFGEAHYNLGNALYDSGRLEEALAHYDTALQLKPDFVEALNNRGAVLEKLGKLDLAVESFRQVLRQRPDHAKAYGNLGAVLAARGDADEAIACSEKAIALEPADARAHNSLGIALLSKGKLEESIGTLRQATRLDRSFAEAHSNLGMALAARLSLEEAIACFHQAINLQRSFARGHWNLGLTLLLAGNYEQGWPEYEWRWSCAGSPPRHFSQPLWDGSSLAGRTILLHAEQGLGDTLLFARYAALVKARGGTVIVECQEGLLPLLSSCRGVDGVVSQGSSLTAFDTHAPLPSLPGIFKTSLEAVPADVPYLIADAGLVERWRKRLSSFKAPGGFKIGIVWRGNDKPNPARSIRFERLAPLAELPGVQWFSLQVDLSVEEERGMEGSMIDIGSRLESFGDTAAAMANLDLIVTIDTAAAHCAGALGLPVWVLLPFAPDWRWLLNREDSPWYPTMRLFRQKRPGDWTEVLERVAVELKKICGPTNRPPGRIDEQPGASATPPALAAALQCHREGNLERAEQLCRETLASNPSNADAFHLLGVISLQTGDSAAAVNLLGQAVRLRPDDPEALNDLGAACKAGGRLDDAVANHRQAIQLRPTFADAHNDLGLALRDQGKLDEATASLGRALELNPAFVEAHYNLGNALHDSGRLEEALEHYDEALRLRPAFAEALNNRGAVLQTQGKADLAEEAFRQALQAKPSHASAHNNLGHIALDHGDLDQAVACFQEAIRLRPNYADAHRNLGIAWLLAGAYERAWPEYEWRLRCADLRPPPFPQPAWAGGALASQTILLHAEQGLGDTFQFIRYAPLVKERGGSVVLACQGPLLPLLSTCTGIDRLVAVDSPFPAYDTHAFLASLPGIFQTTLATVPADVPYLHAEPRLIEHWRSELEPFAGFRVAISWQGNPGYRADRERSIPLIHFLRLAQVDGVRLLSVQKKVGLEQLAALSDRALVTDLGPRLDEENGAFMDTAAVMKNVDLVITSDSATAHLAGALGVLVWMAIPAVPDWRWLLDREDCPWYPTMRLFRQRRPGDWPEVFDRIAGELRCQLRRP